MTRCLAFVLTVALWVGIAGTASAGTVTAPNACAYSYDGYFRDTGVSLSGAGAVVPMAADPSASDAADVVPGQRLTLSGVTLHFLFPEELIRFGYTVGLLNAGDNTINVKGWVALKASNTKEATQVVGPLNVTATTHITVDAADDGRFVSATPLSYTDPVLPPTTWTATGGDVGFSQADGGALGPLPIGPSGANRTPVGSAVIQTNLNGANFAMDCVPGGASGVNPSDGAGPGYTAAPAAAFDTIAGPLNVTCLDSLGRQVSGAAANLPDGVSRELNPIGVRLSDVGAAPKYTSGSPYVLTGARAQIVLGADTVATLARIDNGGTPLIKPDRTYPLRLWVTLAASNTAEHTQTVAATATYRLDAPTVLFDLPATTWTPTGAGPLAFSLAAPGTTVSSTDLQPTPYGPIVLRGDTEATPLTFDCVPGAITIADDTIAWSDHGRLGPPNGSLGRYALDVPSTLPAFLVVGVPDKAPDAPAPPPAGGNNPAPAIKPPAPVATSVATFTTKSLKADKRHRVKLALRCAGSPCSGTVVIKTAATVRIGARSKVVTVVAKRSVSIAAGRSATLTLTLSPDARRALTRRATLTVVVTYTPKSGKTVTKRLRLRR